VAEQHQQYRSDACLAAVKTVAASGGIVVLRCGEGRKLLAAVGKMSVELQEELVECSRHGLVLAQRRAMAVRGARLPPLSAPSRGGLPAAGRDEVTSVADAVPRRPLPPSLGSATGAAPLPLVVPAGCDEELAADLLLARAANARECSDRSLQVLVTCVEQHVGAVRERMY